MRHIGFQRTFLNDPYHIQERLQEYDPYLSILYNPKTNEHLIFDDLMGVAIMKIPQRGFEWLDSRVVSHIKRIHTANGFSATKQAQEWERQREKEQQRQRDDLADNFAKDMFNADDKKFLFKGA